MDCTVGEVLAQAQVFIGDQSGEITQSLLSYYQLTYAELAALLLKINAQEITREVYKTLPAYTNVLFPAQLGVNDFAEPQQLWERGGVSAVDIVSVMNGTPITVEVSSPIAGSNNRVELNGIRGTDVPSWINRDWFITILTPTTFTLNGSYAIVGSSFATVTPTGDESWTAQVSNEQFRPMTTMDYRPPPGNIVATETLDTWRWEGNALYFYGAVQPRQLWIQYFIDQTPPDTGIIGLCQGRELQFLAMATAARFEMSARQMPAGPGHLLAAYGSSGEADGSGGLLRQVMAPIWKQKQQLQSRSGYFRPRRGYYGGPI